MSTSKRIAARDVIRVEDLGKRRTAVVLVTDEDTDAISVIFGTRTHRAGDAAAAELIAR